MNPRVLVTGATGFLGVHLLPLLSERFEVHAVARAPESKNTSGVKWHQCDLMEAAPRRKLVWSIEPSHLVHLAWVTEHGHYWSSAENLDWVAMSLKLLRDFESAGGRRAVMVGSCAEYDWTNSGPYSETSPTHPDTLYGACKLGTGAISLAFCAEASVSLSWARLFHPYGPREHQDRLVPSLIRSALNGDTPLPRNPGTVLDLMFVADAASALEQLLESEVEGVVNVCTGRPVQLLRLASEISELLGVPPPEITDAVGGEVIVGEATRLHTEVGYTDGHTLTEGLQATVDWWRNRPSATR